MKLIHCADLHLDSNMTTHLSREHAKQRRAELLSSFERMISFACQEGVQAVLIAGDLFDRKNISATARKTVYHAIVNHPRIDFYYLQGNHDVSLFLPEGEPCPDNLKLFGTEWTSYVRDGEGRRIVISGMELNQDNSSFAGSSLTLDRQNFNIVLLHGQEAEYAGKDRAEIVPLWQLRGKGIDYLALGHVHAYRKEVLDDRGVYCYSGCLEGRGFDECGEHGFVLLNIDTETGDFTSEFVPFASRCLHTVDVDVSNCMSTAEMLEEINRICTEKKYRSSDFLKIVLRGEVELDCEKDPDYLVSWLQNDFYFVKVKDQTRIRIDYDQYMLDESLKGEFVRTVKEDESLSEEDREQIIRYGIRALAGEVTE